MDTIHSAEDIKEFYINTDITSVSAVQSAIKEISSNKHIAGSEKYLEALNAATAANIKKATWYGFLANSAALRNIGWILMGLFAVLMAVVDSDFEDTITTWLSLGFWVGVGVQVYISALKRVWDKLTLSGAVIHPALRIEVNCKKINRKKVEV